MKDLIEYTNKRYPRTTLALGESGKKISQKIRQDGQKFDTLYRGVPSTWDFLENLSVGDNVSLNHKIGFVSTSQSERIARQFAFDSDSEIQVIFEIKDAHGLDVNDISKWDEQEVLLDRKQEWVVQGIERISATTFKIIVN
jgi:hypothetical protein